MRPLLALLMGPFPHDSFSSSPHQALGLYTRSLAGMLRSSPEALFSEEDWQVGASSRGGTPVTQLPRRLQVGRDSDEKRFRTRGRGSKGCSMQSYVRRFVPLQAVVASAMRCYETMLQVTCRVSEPPEGDSWRPLQEGFFAAFSAFCASATELSTSSSVGEGGSVQAKEDLGSVSMMSVSMMSVSMMSLRQWSLFDRPLDRGDPFDGDVPRASIAEEGGDRRISGTGGGPRTTTTRTRRT